MKTSMLFFVCMGFISNVGFAQSFIGRYGDIKSARFQVIHQDLQRSQFLENLAAEMSRGIQLPQQVVISLGECGSPNAFYNPRFHVIVLCHELIEQVTNGILRDFSRVATQKEIADSISGGIGFIFMHELGHALIHVLEIPILGREEDAADQIGAYFLLTQSAAPYGLAGALWFFRPNTLIYTRRHFSDEHSIGPQRQSNLACWAFGKNPNQYQYLLRNYVTRERAVRCGAEYRQLETSVRKLLGGHVQLPPAAR